jgi:predicted nucleotidyltransferase
MWPKFTATGWSALSCTAHARGDYHPDSDYDIAVFIKDPGTLTEELDKLASLTTAILLDTGAVISAKPFMLGPTKRAPFSCTTSARTASIYETGDGRLSGQSTRMP